MIIEHSAYNYPNFKNGMKNIIYLISISIFLLTSCKSIQYVPIETVRTEYVDRNLLRIDSIYMRDSIHIKQLNDTIFVDKYQYIYRNIYLADTVQIIKADSIPYPVEVIKDKIIYKTKWYQNIFMYGFWILLIILLIKLFLNKLKNFVIPFL